MNPIARPFCATAWVTGPGSWPCLWDIWGSSNSVQVEELRPCHCGFYHRAEGYPCPPGLQLGSRPLGPATLGGHRRPHKRPTVLHLILPRFYLMPCIQHIVDFFPQRAALFFFSKGDAGKPCGFYCCQECLRRSSTTT